MEKQEWSRKDQSMYDCLIPPLSALKRHNWLTLDEYEHILNYIQEKIDNKATKDPS